LGIRSEIESALNKLCKNDEEYKQRIDQIKLLVDRNEIENKIVAFDRNEIFEKLSRGDNILDLKNYQIKEHEEDFLELINGEKEKKISLFIDSFDEITEANKEETKKWQAKSRKRDQEENDWVMFTVGREDAIIDPSDCTEYIEPEFTIPTERKMGEYEVNEGGGYR